MGCREKEITEDQEVLLKRNCNLSTVVREELKGDM